MPVSLLDYGRSDTTSIEEFISGCYNLQREPRGMDMTLMQYEIRVVRVRHDAILEHLNAVLKSLGQQPVRRRPGLSIWMSASAHAKRPAVKGAGCQGGRSATLRRVCGAWNPPGHPLQCGRPRALARRGYPPEQADDLRGIRAGGAPLLGYSRDFWLVARKPLLTSQLYAVAPLVPAAIVAGDAGRSCSTKPPCRSRASVSGPG